jgi:hypothetical protein
MTVRFFLGAGEASIAPGFTLLTGMFYKREEQPLRYVVEIRMDLGLANQLQTICLVLRKLYRCTHWWSDRLRYWDY